MKPLSLLMRKFFIGLALAIALSGCEFNGTQSSGERARSVISLSLQVCRSHGGVSATDMVEAASDDAVVTCKDGHMEYVDG